MKVIIIGGGPAGMLAAISSAEQNNEVIILEKMNSLGKKLLITGKGRCNITSSLNINEFINNIPGNGKFLYSALMSFTNQDILNLLEEEGLKTKEERGNRIFPVTDKAQDVLNALIKRLKKLKVQIKLNAKVEKILVENGKANGVIVNGEKFYADKTILATGGKSYPITGSTGDGYILAKQLGHNIIDIKPSLVGLLTYEKDICKSLQGLTLKNIRIKILDDRKIIYEDFGEMLFTHFGVSGPIIISSSAHLLRYKDVYKKLEQKQIKLHIDLKPALDNEKLELRLLRDFEQFKNKQFKNVLDNLLPQRLIDVIIKLSNINPKKQVNQITKNERLTLIHLLKNLEFTIKNFEDIDYAIITSGGIDTKQINPKTMESRLIKGLYFAGEIIDVDAYTGGFNLQIAYATGYLAGRN